KGLKLAQHEVHPMTHDPIEANFEESGAAAAIRQNQGSLPEHRQNLRKATGEFIKLRNQERRRLVDKLQAAIAADEANPDRAIEERMNREVNGGGIDGRPEFGPGQSGAGGSGTPGE